MSAGVSKSSSGGGKYKTKALNLSKEQLKRAGGAAAAKKRTVDISKTSRATSGENKGKTLGPGGKPLTGTVTMLDGSKAVYKNGKRVTNVPKSAAKPKAQEKKTPPPPKQDKREMSSYTSGSYTSKKKQNKDATKPAPIGAKPGKKEPAKKPSSNQSPAARIRESIANLRIETKSNKKTQKEYLNRYGTTQGGKRIK
jgi:hypothetical protein